MEKSIDELMAKGNLMRSLFGEGYATKALLRKRCRHNIDGREGTICAVRDSKDDVVEVLVSWDGAFFSESYGYFTNFDILVEVLDDQAN